MNHISCKSPVPRTPRMATSACSTLAVAKKQLRKKLRNAVCAMTIEQKKAESAVVAQEVLASEWYRSSERVSVYLSTDEEVDTTVIVTRLTSLESRLKSVFWISPPTYFVHLFLLQKCFVPRVQGTTMSMLSVQSLEDVQSLTGQQWGITQPHAVIDREDALQSGGLDLIIVPGLGFTVDGYRLGRGKGYYDRYLSQCINCGFTPTTVGLSFNTQICKTLPTTGNDVKLDYVMFLKT